MDRCYSPSSSSSTQGGHGSGDHDQTPSSLRKRWLLRAREQRCRLYIMRRNTTSVNTNNNTQLITYLTCQWPCTPCLLNASTTLGLQNHMKIKALNYEYDRDFWVEISDHGMKARKRQPLIHLERRTEDLWGIEYRHRPIFGRELQKKEFELLNFLANPRTSPEELHHSKVGHLKIQKQLVEACPFLAMRASALLFQIILRNIEIKDISVEINTDALCLLQISQLTMGLPCRACSKHSNLCRTWVLTVARCEFNAYLTLWGCRLARSSLGDPMLERFSGSYDSILFGPCPLVIPLCFISNPTNYSTIACLIVSVPMLSLI
ncbi:LOW QUALITY PROTEIN: hypothetical protein NC653_010249 [Populus alba x Populus x berolinensis]|uniref:Uncharacterized protein n=1 Tax=Populus alba x Populus x berolinensis TaxID=444605 RepID=A0AAD6W516_9ROSI|nr:LOW QUALITY PROTEIN: hypothetical protein NC653_010249 [Populus alba x Populus x berolinensis]